MAKKDETLLDKLNAAADQRKIKRFSERSYEWFRNRARNIGGPRARKELEKHVKSKGNTVSSWKAGYMYSYMYDAKHKDTLPYWDAFPLIILIGPAKNGFYGLNLHYLPPKARAILFDRLLDLATNKRYDEKTRIKLSYDLLKSTEKYALFKNCFKHYLWKQVESRMMFIPADEWEAALFLPTQDFQKASNTKVWSDTVRKGVWSDK